MEEEKPKKESSPMMLMMIMLFMMLFLFDPNIRKGIGQALHPVLFPVIGFNYTIPMVTLICAGLLSISFSTIIRHFTTDWMELAKIQKVQSDFNKQMRAARLANDSAKVKKLQDKQPEILKMSMKLSTTQMRVMPITMIFIIPIFTWLWVFMGGLPVSTVSVPWAAKVDMTSNPSWCFFPSWLILYSLLTIPFSQVLQRSLKMYKFRERIAELPEEEEIEE